jgi:hypothetical protein
MFERYIPTKRELLDGAPFLISSENFYIAFIFLLKAT